MSATYFVVRVNDDTGAYSDNPFDGLYGDEPTVYTSREKAEAHAAELSVTGNWPDGEQPTYRVEEVGRDDLFPMELKQLNSDHDTGRRVVGN